MGIRAYLLISLKKGVQQKESDEIMQKINALDDVDFLDAVTGPHDLIAMVEVPVTVETIVKAIQGIDGVDSIQSCQILGVHKRW